MKLVMRWGRATTALFAAGALATAGSIAAAPVASAAVGVQRLMVTEGKTGLTGLPSTLTVGEYDVQFRAPMATHGVFFQFIRLSAGYTRSEMLSDLLAAFTGHSTVAQRTRLYANAVFAGGSEGQVDRFTTYLSPGRYVVGDFQAGLIQDLSVSGNGTATGRVPSPTGTITAVNANNGGFNFAVSGSVRHDGSLRFSNSTDEPHFLALAKLAPGATAKGCIFHNKGCSPGYGSGVISQGHSEVIAVSALHLTPGRYVIACFIPDEETGMPHAFMGMYREINVT